MGMEDMDLKDLEDWPLAKQFGGQMKEIYDILKGLYLQAGVSRSPVFVKHKNIGGQDYFVEYD
jgi:hypothetical protein